MLTVWICIAFVPRKAACAPGVVIIDLMNSSDVGKWGIGEEAAIWYLHLCKACTCLNETWNYYRGRRWAQH